MSAARPLQRNHLCGCLQIVDTDFTSPALQTLSGPRDSLLSGADTWVLIVGIAHGKEGPLYPHANRTLTARFTHVEPTFAWVWRADSLPGTCEGQQA